jgi:hypothetical protein
MAFELRAAGDPELGESRESWRYRGMRKPIESTLEHDVGFRKQSAQRGEDLVRPGTSLRKPQTE